MQTIMLLDFGMGNIRSLQKAFEFLGAKVEITANYHKAMVADVLLLPGDGAFGKAMQELKKLQLQEVIQDFVAKKKPLLGICIGFQLLFESSDEFGQCKGLGVLPGKIERLEGKPNLQIPHIGWNITNFNQNSLLAKNLPPQNFFYYVHSYCLKGNHSFSTATSVYGSEFTAVIEKENIFATQFHPEKSQKAGLKILKNFLEVSQCF